MSQADGTTYLLLDRHQGHDAPDGWRVGNLSGLQIGAEGLTLAAQAAPPVPLKDGAGAFGGLENPTGVAVAPGGVIYVADSGQHLIYSIVRRKALQPRAHFFRIHGGPYKGERFVYLPTANRVERWPRALGREPRSLSEVEIICETVWNLEQARRAALAFANGEAASCERPSCCEDCARGCGCAGAVRREERQACGCRKDCGCAGGKTEDAEAGIDKEWEGEYPSGLPAGEICEDSISYLPCLGGLGREPRQFNQPRGLAVSASNQLYVADSQNHRVQVFSLRGLVLQAVWGRRAGASDVKTGEAGVDCVPAAEGSVRLGQPIAGDAPGEFKEPWDVASDAAGEVYIADKGNHRVQKYDPRTRRFQVFDGTTLAAHFFQVLYGPSFKDRFVFIPARRRLELWPHALGHDPQDASEAVIVGGEVSTVNEARRLVLQAVEATGSGDILTEYRAAYPPALAAGPQAEPAFQSPAHLAIDRRGRVYVADEGVDYVKILDRAGRVLGRVEFASEVQGKFRPTAIAVDDAGRLVLAGEGGAHRFDVEGERSFYDAFYGAWRGRCADLVRGGDGNLIAVGIPDIGVAELKPPASFLKQGTYVSRALDSETEDCQWHKLLLDIPREIPVGTSLTVSTYTSSVELTPADIAALDDGEWHTNQTNAENFLVLSGPGRYLWLKIEMRGGGAETPALKALRAYFPRQSYLQYLPAIYQADPASRDFLARFLSIFEEIFGGIEARVENLWQLFDPEGAPAAAPHDFLSWLAGWVDMLFDASWTTETRRSLLRHAPELYRRRGTPAGLKLLLKLALGVEVHVLEHFQLRRWLFLSAQSSLCNSSELYDNCVVNRLQLDECARVGVSGLIYTPDPLRDPFFVHAHRFSVYVRAGEVRGELAERMMRHLIEREKPAHTSFDLVKVEPHFRVGMQSTVGLDTHVGAYPRTVLNQCSTLGYDTLLGCERAEEGAALLQVGARSRVGVSAVVG
jgi:phage tail-like protein